ncbi:MAG TPA: DnaJ domain-containing protein [Pyrinomonadaceae bacterium]|nr:DnaJ domain-containing protein [Pyrinomonadaceae bacterium]
MSAQNSLDLKGKLSEHPLAELIVEIAQSQLSGSLRLARDAKKVIVYFREGAVIFAVSNAREHRLFHHLIEKSRLPKESVMRFPNAANDIELAQGIVNEGLLEQKEIDEAIVAIMADMIVDCLMWPDGDWHFSPLARLRDDVSYSYNVHQTLIDYARCLPLTTVESRFKSVNESFKAARVLTFDDQLLPHEAFVHSSFNGSDQRIEDLRLRGGMPEQGLLQGLYVLWLGGLLFRKDWNSAFTPAKIQAIREAKIARVREAPKVAVADAAQADEPETGLTEGAPEQEKVQRKEIKLTREEYLKRTEESETFYDLLGVDEKAGIDEIKHAYFGMAKLFHPDRYHKEEPTTLRRIQVAFTNLAHAYETLKNAESRKAYDFKVRKELEAREQRRAQGLGENEVAEDVKATSSRENFEEGMKALADDDYDAASTFLARAVHYSPENALYRAYYGHALSGDDRMRHKAESELQAAVKLEPADWKIRSMLVEFFVDMGLTKRAVGELKRYLEVAPGNTEAAGMLARLQREA